MEDLEARETDGQGRGASGTTQPARATNERSESRSEGDCGLSRNRASRNILVIDDDADIRFAVVGALEEEGFSVMSASNGLEALEILRVLPIRPSLILMDLMMPVMDGWEFRAEQLRDPLLSKVPVVVFSAHENVREEAIQVSASAYLRKPFSLDDLFGTIGKICGDPV